MRKRILFFGPFEYRARDNESLMLHFKKMGHEVFFLTMLGRGAIFSFLQQHGITCDEMAITGEGKISTIRRFLFLLKYIRDKKIDVVFSHLEPANFLSVLVQPFVKAKIVIVRHHSDLFILNGLHNIFSYRFTYKNAKHIIAVSDKATRVMVEQEGVLPEKIKNINLSYDFSLFDTPVIGQVQLLKRKLNSTLLFLSVGRLVENKRFHLAIETIARLRKMGIDAGLFILGEGHLLSYLRGLVNKMGLEKSIHFEGYKANIMDYLEVSDILLHPSDSEASSIIVKEAGVRKKPVIVCKGVGDFDSYITNGENGFLVDPDDFVEQAVEVSIRHLGNQHERAIIGNKLYVSVNDLFNVEKNYKAYLEYFQ